MIDVHTHVLPHMDDGSRSVAESLAMLEESAGQGITGIVATPHFYAWENSPEEFLERRTACAEKLYSTLRPGLPEVRLGAEVCYFEGMSRAEGLEALRIEGTKLLLLEMPFCPWSQRVLREVWELQAKLDLTVALAHAERYLRWEGAKIWSTLGDLGVLIQCNAGFLLNWRTRRKALGLLRSGRIHMLGSDCHNMEGRPPRLGKALALLSKEDRALLEKNREKFLSGWGR